MSRFTRMSAPDQLRPLRRTLKRTFGLESLRPGQAEVIRAVLAGDDVLAIMPTGAGKLLCYQLPALHLEGTTVVVSPLIALMKDQTDKLDELGLDAAQVNSAVPAQEQASALEAIEYTATVKHVGLVADALAAGGIDALTYHGRMPAQRRVEIQEEFLSGRARMIVATNAFGMGIDRADIRAVIHYRLEGSAQ